MTDFSRRTLLGGLAAAGLLREAEAAGTGKVV